jgi:hypothetical protein
LSTEGEGYSYKVVITILLLAIPALLIFFGLISLFTGGNSANSGLTTQGNWYLIIGIVIYVVELIAYVILRRQGRIG